MKSESFVRRKGVQCEVTYRRERADLARAHRRAADAGATAQRVSERFWKEVTQPTRTQRGAGAPHSTAATPEERLARARALQAQLVTARGAHATAQAAVGVHGARVVQADALQQKVQRLAADLQRRSAAQRSERRDDALADQLATYAARGPTLQGGGMMVGVPLSGGAPGRGVLAEGHRRSPALHTSVRQGVAACEAESEGAAGGALRSLPEPSARLSATSTDPGCTVLPQSTAASEGAGRLSSQHRLPPTAAPAAALRIEQVELDRAELDHATAAVTVRVQCALSSGAAVQVALTQVAGGALSAVVESPNLALAAQLKRERAGLLAKLGARGVAVESLEVRGGREGACAHTVGAPAGHTARRRGAHAAEEEFTP